MKRRFSLGWGLAAVILGALMGSAMGQIVGLLFPDGVVKDFFLRAASIGFSPTEINLVIISFTLGFTFNLNIIGLIGIIIAAYIFRWYA